MNFLSLSHVGISILINWKSPSLLQIAIPFFTFAVSVLVFQVYKKCWFVYILRKPFSVAQPVDLATKAV